MGKPFVINRHGRLVFPSNFLGDLDFSCLETEEQLSAVVRRDFEAKAPTGTDIEERAESGAYSSRYELLRDVALHLFWANRYAMTMYDKRPRRWRDVPKHRDDVFLPVLTPWEGGEHKVAAMAAAYESLPAAFPGGAEDRIHEILFEVVCHKLNHATELRPIKPTVEEFIADEGALTFCLSDYDPDYPVYTYDQFLDCAEDVPELEALHRMAMVLHNQYPWNLDHTRLETAAGIGDDEFVVMFVPRNRQVSDFIRHVKAGRPARPRPAPPNGAVKPAATVPPVVVAERFAIMPRLESLAVVMGEQRCTNDDVVRNSAYSWSPMSADDISSKTGIRSRFYTERGLEEMSLSAATAALRGAGRAPEEIAAIVFCSCTSTRLIPSVACWLSGQLGIYQTHASFDLVAACAGFPYGLAEAVRVIQDVQRPVLVVCAEKFSDKIGNVRTSRMIFGDGAAAMIVAPAAAGEESDIEVVQTFASGPASQVNSIIWPNPEFDNDITVWGPEVKALVERYLIQIMDELRALPGPAGGPEAMIDAIDLIVPHQANQVMVTQIATQVGLSADQLYFNIDRVGNMSSASIPIAIHDAVVDGVIDRPMRILGPGFGAGAVAGYAIVRIDPAIIVPQAAESIEAAEAAGHQAMPRVPSGTDVQEAFG